MLNKKTNNLKLSSMNFKESNSNLFGYDTLEDHANKKVKDIEIDKLFSAPDEWNFYSELSEDKKQELTDSILKNGLLHPIVVWEREDGYMILSGHNRTWAFRHLYEVTKDEKYKKIPALVKGKSEIDEILAQEIIVDTNWVQRQLNVRDKVTSIVKKYGILGRKSHTGDGLKTRDIIAKDFNISGRQVSNYVKLADLIPELRELVNNCKLSIQSGTKLAGFKPAMQKWILLNFNSDLDNKKITKLENSMTKEQITGILTECENYKRISFKVPEEDMAGLCNLINKYMEDKGLSKPFKV